MARSVPKISSPFTKEELDVIIETSRSSLAYRLPGIVKLMNSARSQDDILASSNKGLILVHGNRSTGLKHIYLRHDYYSHRIQFNRGRFDTPSKFPSSTTVLNYLLLADEVCKPENYDEEKSCDKYDCYRGLVNFGGENKRFARLLLYKGYHVIHTMYVEDSNFFKYIKGEVKYSSTFPRQLMIPYHRRKDGKLMYGVSVEKNYVLNEEHTFLVIFDPESNDLKENNHMTISKREIPSFLMEDIEVNIYQECDLKDFERIIEGYELKIEEGQIEFIRKTR